MRKTTGKFLNATYQEKEKRLGENNRKKERVGTFSDVDHTTVIFATQVSDIAMTTPRYTRLRFLNRLLLQTQNGTAMATEA